MDISRIVLIAFHVNDVYLPAMQIVETWGTENDIKVRVTLQ